MSQEGSEIVGRLSQVLAQREADSLTKRHEIARALITQTLDGALRRINSSFGYLAIATAKTMLSSKRGINSIETCVAGLEAQHTIIVLTEPAAKKTRRIKKDDSQDKDQSDSRL